MTGFLNYRIDSSKIKFSKAKNNIENIKSIELKGFTEKDVLKILNRQKKERNVTSFVNFLMNKTNGNPCFILDIAKRIKENNSVIPENYKEAYKYINSLESFFASFKTLWLNDSVSKELLKLFVIFERIGYLTVEDMQSYLISTGKQVDSDSINQHLQLVVNQLDINDDGKYKLKYNAFARYLIEKYTVADFEMFFNSVSDWLSSKKVYSNLVPLFLSWNIQTDTNEAKTEIIIQKSDIILDILIANEIIAKSNIIQFMCTVARHDKEIKKRLHPYIIKCFDTLVNMGCYDVVSDYITYLYDTSDTVESRKKVVDYIKTLADQGNKSASLCYAKLMQYGDIYTTRDIDQAVHYFKMSGENFNSIAGLYNTYNEIENKLFRNEYLNKLIKYDEEEAQIIYAWHLATGVVYEKDVCKSCNIFDRLINNNSFDAMLYKAEAISSGMLDNCKIEEAFELWDKAAKHKTKAFFEKGKYLYNNGEPEKGYKLIRHAYENGNVDAALYIANDNLDKSKSFNAELVDVLSKIVAKSCEENQQAATYIYLGVKYRLIKKYSKYNLDSLYHFAYNSICFTEAMKYYNDDNYEDAFSEFENAYINGDFGSANNMAYTLRRNEAKSDKYIIEDLLMPSVDANNTFAVVNYALEIIKHSSDIQTFDKAIKLLKIINTNQLDFDNAIRWWEALTNQKNDCEGDLVLGLLLYVGKLDTDPDGKDVQTRLQTASNAGYAIADYILSAI